MTVVCFYCGDEIPDALPHTCEGCGARLTLRLNRRIPMEQLDAVARSNGYRMGMHYTGAEAIERVRDNLGSTLRLLLSPETVAVPEASA